MVKARAGGVLDRMRVCFDDERAVANAGLLLPATLAARLGLEQLVNEAVDLSGRPGGAGPGRKVLTLYHAMLLGADSIDGCDVLRSGRTGLVLGHELRAPSTLGTFLRSFSPSGTCASSTASSARPCGGRGRPELALARSGS